MIPLDVSGKETFSKHYAKRRKCWLPAFSPFPTMFSTLSQTVLIIYVTFILSSANALNLDTVKFLSSGNGLTDTKPLHVLHDKFGYTTVLDSLKLKEISDNNFRPGRNSGKLIDLIKRKKKKKKILKENEKLLVSSNFSFSLNVFISHYGWILG